MQVVLQKTHGNGLIVLSDSDYQKMPNNCIALIEEPSSGSMSMKNLWWSWMQTTAAFMAGNGVTMPLMINARGEYYGSRPFDKNDAHELFTSKWMGTDENGKRYSWKVRNPAENERIATKSMRLHAMEEHQCWCVKRGIKLLNPEDSEFRKLQKAQDK